MSELDISAYRLSKETGISESKLSLWFAGKQDITLGLFLKVVKVLKLRIEIKKEK